MSNFIQLNLFNKELPNWANITIEWLLEYLVSLYPEMKFKLFEEEDYDGNNYFCIKQTAFKKVKLEFSSANQTEGLSRIIDEYNKLIVPYTAIEGEDASPWKNH